MHIFIYSFDIIYSDEEETFFWNTISTYFWHKNISLLNYYYYYNHYYRICLTFEIDCWNIHFAFRHTLVYDIKNKILFNMKFQFNVSFARIYMKRTRFDVYFDIYHKRKEKQCIILSKCSKYIIHIYYIYLLQSIVMLCFAVIFAIFFLFLSFYSSTMTIDNIYVSNDVGSRIVNWIIYVYTEVVSEYRFKWIK